MIVAGLILIGCSPRKNEIERLSMINLLKGTETVEIVDNGEFEVDGKFMIPQKAIDKFSRENDLQPLENVASYSEQFIKLLSIENTPQVEKKDEYLWLEDCNANNHWRFLLDEHTGELWTNVEYPGKDGDAPPCNK